MHRLLLLAVLLAALPVAAQPILLNTSERVPNTQFGGDGFGNKVELSADGRTALFPVFQSNGQQGAVHVFREEGGVWSHEQRVSLTEDPPAEGEIGEQFGFEAAISADGSTFVAAAAATGFNTSTSDFGDLVVFERADGGTWTETARLRSANVASGNVRYTLPIAMSPDGSAVFVMANPLDTSDNSFPPAFITYERDGSGWVERDPVVAQIPAGVSVGGAVGMDIEISGDGQTLAMGARYGGGGALRGYVHVFAREGGVWVQRAIVEPDQRTGNSQDFAESIAIDGDGTTLAVRNSGFDQFNSAVYMFTREGETWTERQFLRPSDAGQSAAGRAEEFGSSLALTADGRFLIATAPEHRDFPVTYGGTAYVFDAGDSSTWTETLRTTVIDNGNENGCGSVAVSADGATTLFGCTGYQETFTDPAGAGAVLSGIAVSSEGSSPRATFTLALPVPNPASGPVAVSYSLSTPGTVRLSVYDALGREVAVVASAERSAGRHTERLDTSLLAPGVYVARLSALGGTRTRRLTIVR